MCAGAAAALHGCRADPGKATRSLPRRPAPAVAWSSPRALLPPARRPAVQPDKEGQAPYSWFLAVAISTGVGEPRTSSCLPWGLYCWLAAAAEQRRGGTLPGRARVVRAYTRSQHAMRELLACSICSTLPSSACRRYLHLCQRDGVLPLAAADLTGHAARSSHSIQLTHCCCARHPHALSSFLKHKCNPLPLCISLPLSLFCHASLADTALSAPHFSTLPQPHCYLLSVLASSLLRPHASAAIASLNCNRSNPWAGAVPYSAGRAGRAAAAAQWHHSPS